MKYKLPHIILWIWLFMFSSISGRGQFTSETFDHMDVSGGLSSAVVTCILKDSRGFMWFGTQQGLNRYDGTSIKIYSRNDSLPGTIGGNFILSLTEDPEGNIWVGTERNGLSRYNRLSDNFTRFINNPDNSNSVSNNTVRATLLTSAGLLFAGTDKGLNSFDFEKEIFAPVNFRNIEDGPGLPAVFSLYEDQDASIWVGTDQGLIHYYPEQGQSTLFKHDPNNEKTLSNNTINQVLRLTDGRLLVATNEGLNILNEADHSFTRFFYREDVPNTRQKSEIQAMAEDNKGNIWIGSFGGGLIKVKKDSQRGEYYLNDPADPKSISSDYINTLYFDEAGIIWIGTYGGGISKIEQVRIRFEQLEHKNNDVNSPAGNEIYTVYTNQDHLFFGSEKGLSICDINTGKYTHYNASEKPGKKLGRSAVYCLEEDEQGNLWAGTAGSGLYQLVNTGDPNFPYRVQKQVDGLPANEIYCLLYAYDSTLWVGSNNGIALIRNGKVVKNFISAGENEASIPDNEVYTIYQDASEQIWVGTFKGLCLFNPADSSFNCFNNNQLLSDPTVYSILQDLDGDLWVGTDNSGLLRFNPKTPDAVRVYSKNDGLPDNVIYGIEDDDEGNLWMSSNNGLFKVMKRSDSDKLTINVYNTGNWLKTDDFNIGSYNKSPDGTIYFGSFEGVTYFSPENVKGNDYIPPVQITGFELFFEPVNISSDGSTVLSANISETKRIVLKHNQNVLKFRFAALNFIEPEKNRYAFIMENLESKWNYTDGPPEAQYLYLPPGEYKFRVRAANNDGIWNNEGASIDIIIKPPFTQTIWFYLLLFIFLVAIIWWFMNIRTRRLKTIRDRLEEQVQKRTYELRETNKNLEAEIQERLKVTEALEKSEARFRQLIDTMNEGFSVQDKDGIIIYVNPKLCEMFGYSSTEILGRNPSYFVDDGDKNNLDKFTRERQYGIKTGKFSSYELKWKRKDGTIFIAMVSPKPIIDPELGYTGSVAVLTDITALKNAENELISKNQELNSALDDLRKTQAQLIDSEKMASLGQLTAGVAHEINNPINFVSGNVQPLRRDIEDVLDVLQKYDVIIEKLKLGDHFNEVNNLKQEIDFDFVLSEINHLLDGIGEGAQRTTEIVKGLRNFSRMDEHELKVANINQGIESTLLILHNKIKERIEVTKHFGDIPDIMCYPGQLNQVFMNIINNAAEAIAETGKIDIRTWHENGLIKITITDSGKGIPRNVKNKIFDPFFTTKEVGKGTGLGLSISFGIIEKHNGKIEVISEPGKGSEFIIQIPDNLN
ncbi:MAG: PAS domain S-box protein [Bacteroidales bacterium]|nr:PAS domain S-box protein [Bacteroidales bacterium]